MSLNETHDPARKSWVDSANDAATDFPIQNLPFGIFSPGADGPRAGIAIGDRVLDLAVAHELALLPQGVPASVFRQPSLNALFSLGQQALSDIRRSVANVLDAGSPGLAGRRHAAQLLHPMDSCRLYRPTDVSNYTDFYAGIHHARAAGALLTPENPLPDNYKWVPIAYHGRASSVQVSGQNFKRPVGQRPPAQRGSAPSFGPSERLDLELELGFYVVGGNQPGEPVSIDNASRHIAGFCLLNDWSARDLQRWEMFPLGPFLSKSFATTVSPWVVTTDALAPFRVPAMARLEGDPTPLPYLFDAEDQASGGLDVALSVLLQTDKMRAANERPVEIISSNARHLYWTPAQMVAHHTVNGCNLLPGDLIGTGTISGPETSQLSSMLELTAGGSRPVTLPSGEQRAFLLDGDEITLRGRCYRDGFASIGFGACTGTVESYR
jgi:fumarylacetoacetase